MKKFNSMIPERFHRMVNATDPSASDIDAARKQLKIEIPSYLISLPNISSEKKKEIVNRYVVNTTRHLIDKEKKDVENDTAFNRLKDKMKETSIAKKMMVKAVVESAVAGEITIAEEYILLESIR